MPDVLTASPDANATGKAEHWDRAAWLILLAMEQDDFDAAIGSFQRHVSPAYQGLITGDGWTFDPQTMQYTRDVTGKRLDDKDLKSIALLYVLAVEHELEDDAARMASGEVELSEWQQSAAGTIKDLYIASGILAAGGVDHLQPEDLDFITGSPSEGFAAPVKTPDVPPGGLADAFARLEAFAESVELKQPGVGTIKAIVHRAGLYAGPAHMVYEQTRRSGWQRVSDTGVRLEEKNILDDDATHCHTTGPVFGCPELTARGWVPFNSLPIPGTRVCQSRCRCRVAVRIKQ